MLLVDIKVLIKPTNMYFTVCNSHSVVGLGDILYSVHVYLLCHIRKLKCLHLDVKLQKVIPIWSKCQKKNTALLTIEVPFTFSILYKELLS